MTDREKFLAMLSNSLQANCLYEEFAETYKALKDTTDIEIEEIGINNPNYYITDNHYNKLWVNTQNGFILTENFSELTDYVKKHFRAVRKNAEETAFNNSLYSGRYDFDKINSCYVEMIETFRGEGKKIDVETLQMFFVTFIDYKFAEDNLAILEQSDNVKSAICKLHYIADFKTSFYNYFDISVFSEKQEKLNDYLYFFYDGSPLLATLDKNNDKFIDLLRWLNTEVWKKIPIDGLTDCFVSNFGRVKTHKGKIAPQRAYVSAKNAGELQVNLHTKWYFVKKLVATAFVNATYEDEKYICRKNKDVTDNHAANLFWAARFEYLQYYAEKYNSYLKYMSDSDIKQIVNRSTLIM